MGDGSMRAVNPEISLVACILATLSTSFSLTTRHFRVKNRSSHFSVVRPTNDLVSSNVKFWQEINQKEKFDRFSRSERKKKNLIHFPPISTINIEFRTLKLYQFSISICLYLYIYIARCTLLIHDLWRSDCATFWYFALKFHREICVPLLPFIVFLSSCDCFYNAAPLPSRKQRVLKINSRKTYNTADDVALSRGRGEGWKLDAFSIFRYNAPTA